jgi:hypothetical protein
MILAMDTREFLPLRMSFSNLHTPSAAKVVAGMVNVILILPILAQPLGITGIRPLPLSTELAQASVTAT